MYNTNHIVWLLIILLLNSCKSANQSQADRLFEEKQLKLYMKWRPIQLDLGRAMAAIAIARV